MKTQKPSAWYDQDFIIKKGAYSRGSYKRRNRKFASMILKYNPKSVFEFAGAEGQLAQFILERNPQLSYVWTDFSQEALKEAYPKLKRFPNCEMKLLDINKDYSIVDWERFDCVVSTALEHIENDLAIIKSIKPKTLVCLALPNFDSIGHIRFFPTYYSINQRYGEHIDYKESRTDYIFNISKIINHLLLQARIKILKRKIKPHKRYLIIGVKKD